jgi:hypothetical protein
MDFSEKKCPVRATCYVYKIAEDVGWSIYADNTLDFVLKAAP